jgi:hypothetical protein
MAILNPDIGQPFDRIAAYFGSGAPGASVPTDQLYFDTSNNYAQYIYTGGAWRKTSDGGDSGAGGPYVPIAGGVAITGALTGALTLQAASGTAASYFTIAEGSIINGYTATLYRTGAQSPNNQLSHARGTVAAPLVVATNDRLGRFSYNGYGASAFQIAAQFDVITSDPLPSNTSMAGRFVFSTSPVGSVTPAENMRVDQATGLSMYGANPVIDQNRVFRLRNFTVGTLPAASSAAGQMTFVTDATLTAITGLGLAPTGGGSNKVPVYSDGSGWIII